MSAATKAKRSLAAHKANWTRKLRKATAANKRPPYIDHSVVRETALQILQDLALVIHCSEELEALNETHWPVLVHEQLSNASDAADRLDDLIGVLARDIREPAVVAVQKHARLARTAAAKKGGAK